MRKAALLFRVVFFFFRSLHLFVSTDDGKEFDEADVI